MLYGWHMEFPTMLMEIFKGDITQADVNALESNQDSGTKGSEVTLDINEKSHGAKLTDNHSHHWELSQ